MDYFKVTLKLVLSKLSIRDEGKVKPEVVSYSPCCHVLLMSLLYAFYFLHTGSQGTFAMYLTTYSVKSALRMTEAEGAYLTSVYWGAMAIAR